MKIKKFFALILMALLVPAYSYAEEAGEYYDEPTGAAINFNEDGSVRSITAIGEADLVFGDAKDVRTAKQKATMRAKANLAKFLNERISSEEVIDDMTKTATETSSSGDATATRNTIETMSERVHNSAEAILKGVVTLTEDVNHNDKVVRVKIGVKEQTIRAADSTKGQMESNASSGSNSNSGAGTYGAFQPGSGRKVNVSPNARDF